MSPCSVLRAGHASVRPGRAGSGGHIRLEVAGLDHGITIELQMAAQGIKHVPGRQGGNAFFELRIPGEGAIQLQVADQTTGHGAVGISRHLAGLQQSLAGGFDLLGAESVILANASACSADEGKFLEFHDYLFKNQKPENSGYWGLSRLTAAGVAAGLKQSTFETCVKSGKYAKWVENIAADGAKSNINQTPTVLINGKEIDRNGGAYLDAALFKKALADAGVK